MSSQKRGVLFVCLGNICRSPIAEAVFQHLIEESAATSSYHTGSPPDHRALEILKERGITTNHKARKLTKNDFTRFEFIFGMDNSNIKNIKQMAPENSTAKIELLGSYDPEGQLIIEDPYYQPGNEGFIHNYEQCLRSCKAFLDKHNK